LAATKGEVILINKGGNHEWLPPYFLSY